MSEKIHLPSIDNRGVENKTAGSCIEADATAAFAHHVPPPKEPALQQLREFVDRQDPKAAKILTRAILSEHREAILKFHNLLEKGEIRCDGDPIYGTNQLINMSYDRIPIATLSRFDGHGITRDDPSRSRKMGVSGVGQLESLIKILKTKQLIGGKGRLAKSGYINAYANCSFLLVSPIDTDLSLRKQNNVATTELNIGAVVVNDQLEPIIEVLRTLFPEITFLTAWEFPDWANEQARKADGVIGRASKTFGKIRRRLLGQPD